MKLNYITIQVTDLEKSLRFYKDVLQLTEQRRFPTNGGEICFVANAAGETQLELIQMAGWEKVQVRSLIMSFTAAGELAAERERVAALGYEPSELLQHGAKPPYFTVADPDGMLVEIG
ncbi:MAG: VOC family protein [Oscillospiraceae bacterium]|nr:VOC family protein [Oscillospiraceae bacterium]